MAVSIPKTEMHDTQNDQIGDFENTPIFPHRGKIGSVFSLLNLLDHSLSIAYLTSTGLIIFNPFSPEIYIPHFLSTRFAVTYLSSPTMRTFFLFRFGLNYHNNSLIRTLVNSSSPPASPSHLQPQLSLGQHPSTGRGISRNALQLLL